MSFNNFTLNAQQAFAPNGIALLVSIKQNIIFVDGKPSGEDGIRLTVVSLADFDKVVVKVPGAKSPIDPDELESRRLQGIFTFVRFTDFSGKIWQDYKTHEMHLTSSATSVEIVDDFESEDLFKGGK